MSILSVSVSRISLSSKPSRPNIDLNLDIPLSALPMAIKGLLNMTEKAVPWKESVTIKCASLNELSHCSTGGYL